MIIVIVFSFVIGIFEIVDVFLSCHSGMSAGTEKIRILYKSAGEVIAASAFQTPLCFFHCFLFIISVYYFLEVALTFVRFHLAHSLTEFSFSVFKGLFIKVIAYIHIGHLMFDFLSLQICIYYFCRLIGICHGFNCY